MDLHSITQCYILYELYNGKNNETMRYLFSTIFDQIRYDALLKIFYHLFMRKSQSFKSFELLNESLNSSLLNPITLK